MRNKLFNSNAVLLLAAPCLVVLIAIAIKVQTAPRTVSQAAHASDLPVGVAYAKRGGFQFQLDEAQLDAAMQQVNSAARTAIKMMRARQSDTPKYQSVAIFKSAVEGEAASKLNQVFPNGVPPGMESKVKIAIKVKPGDPHEVTVEITI